MSKGMNNCPKCPVCAVWRCVQRCVQRLVRLFPRRHYKRLRFGRLTVWVFPFWWTSGEAIIGKSIGPITFLLRANATGQGRGLPAYPAHDCSTGGSG